MGTFEEGSAALIAGLERIGLEFLIYVPCGQSELIVDHFERQKGVRVLTVCREEEGVAALSGISLAGNVGVMIMQDNGLGACLNALTTIPEEYHIPALFVVPRGGGFGEGRVGIQHLSETLVDVLDAARIKSFVLDHTVPLGEWANAVEQAQRYSLLTRRPVVVFYNLRGWGSET